MSSEAPSDGQAASRKRPLIQLPSLREVQSAEQARTPASQFRSISAPSRDAGEPAQRDALRHTSLAAGGAADPYRQGTGVFSPANKSSPSADQQAPASALRPKKQPATMYQQQTPSTSYLQAGVPYSVPIRPTMQYASTLSRAAAPPQHVNPNAILVSQRQKGNPVLQHIRNVRYAFADIIPDYQMGQQTCALFLSLRYHLLNPKYIYGRIKELQRAYRLRVLLCYVDTEDAVDPLAQVTKAALLNDCTLLCAWTPLECARYLETLKSYETKPADLIQGRSEEDYLSKLNAAFTTVRGINKTDVLTLAGAFKTAAGIMRADMQELSALPGIGPTKVKRLHETFHEPFRKALRQGPLSFSPTQAAAQQRGQQAEQTSQGATADAAASAVAAMPAIGMPMESALEDADDDQIEMDLRFL